MSLKEAYGVAMTEGEPDIREGTEEQLTEWCKWLAGHTTALILYGISGSNGVRVVY